MIPFPDYEKSPEIIIVKEKSQLEMIAPKKQGMLDMVIAFDTTGSMADYIGAVRKEVASLIPNLFKDNEDLRLGIVAFGDYCDMKNAQEFGKAYQCIAPTDNVNALIKFVIKSEDTCGGDGDEFYELVIKKIVEETPWREGSTRAVLLIADSCPHKPGYSYENIVKDSPIDWEAEAMKAANKRIKFDTVTICDQLWFRHLSAMTNGVNVPFRTSGKTGRLIEMATMARGSEKSRRKFDSMINEMIYDCPDKEIYECLFSYKSERDKI